MEYKVLVICAFRKDEFHVRQAGKGHQGAKRIGMHDTREN